MNNKSLFLLGVTLFMTVGFQSCKDDNIPENLSFEQFKYVYLSAAKDGLKNITVLEKDTTLLFGGIKYGGTTDFGQTVEAVIEGDLSLVDGYNAANNTTYLPLPANYFSLDKTTLTIENGKSYSNAASLTIKGASLEPEVQYLLPVTVKSITAPADLPLNGEMKTAWWVITSSNVVSPIKASWFFDDETDLAKATVGKALALIETGGAITSVEGPTAANKAIRIPLGSHLIAEHGLVATGGEARVNDYTLIIDFKVPSIGSFKAFMQTNLANNDDADLFVRPSGQIGISSGFGYSDAIIEADKWYRLVVSSKLGEYCKLYLNGTLLHTAMDNSSVSRDSRWSLDPAGVLLFGDDAGEDDLMDISGVSFWNKPLTGTEIAALGTPVQDVVVPNPTQDFEKPTWTVEVSSVYPDGPAAGLIDGSADNFWHSGTSDPQPWAIIDLQKPRLISGILHLGRQYPTIDGYGSSPKHIIFYVSDDKENWETLVDVPALEMLEGERRSEVQDIPAPVPMRGRYLKIFIESNWAGYPWSYIGEIDLY